MNTIMNTIEKNNHLIGWSSVADEHICVMRQLSGNEPAFEICLAKSNKNLDSNLCEWDHSIIFPLEYNESNLDKIFRNFNDYSSFRDFLKEQPLYEQYMFANDGSIYSAKVLTNDVFADIAMYIAEYSFSPRIVEKDWALHRVYQLSGYQFEEV